MLVGIKVIKKCLLVEYLAHRRRSTNVSCLFFLCCYLNPEGRERPVCQDRSVFKGRLEEAPAVYSVGREHLPTFQSSGLRRGGGGGVGVGGGGGRGSCASQGHLVVSETGLIVRTRGRELWLASSGQGQNCC